MKHSLMGSIFHKGKYTFCQQLSHNSSLLQYNGGASGMTVWGNCLNPIFRKSPLTAPQKLELRHKEETDLLQRTAPSTQQMVFGVGKI